MATRTQNAGGRELIEKICIGAGLDLAKGGCRFRKLADEIGSRFARLALPETRDALLFRRRGKMLSGFSVSKDEGCRFPPRLHRVNQGRNATLDPSDQFFEALQTRFLPGWVVCFPQLW